MSFGLQCFFEYPGPGVTFDRLALNRPRLEFAAGFPSVIKAGIGIGGEYGEGALRIGGKTVDYYNTAAASIGFQLGAQSKRVIIVFMENEALKAAIIDD